MAAQEEETGAKAEGEAGVKAEGEAGAKAEWEVGEATVEVEGKEVDKVEDEVKSAGGLVSKPDVQAVVVNSEIVEKLSEEFQSNNVDEENAVNNVEDQVPKVEDVEVTMEEEAATSVRELLDSLEARVEGVRRAAAALQGEQEELLGSLRAVGAGVGELGVIIPFNLTITSLVNFMILSRNGGMVLVKEEVIEVPGFLVIHLLIWLEQRAINM